MADLFEFSVQATVCSSQAEAKVSAQPRSYHAASSCRKGLKALCI